MKINFKLDERKISKSSRSKIYDLGQVTTTVQNLLDNSEITITDNLIPIIKITSIDNETSYYLLPDLNYDWGNISGRNNYSFTINDLIALGGNSGGGNQNLQSVTDLGNTTNNDLGVQAGDYSASYGSQQLNINNNDTGKAAYLSADNGLTLNTTGTGGEGTVKGDLLTGIREYQLPDENGTLSINNYKEYNINLSQSSTDDPVIDKTITNTLGTTLTWARDNTGVFLSSIFTVPDYNSVSILYNDTDIPYQLQSRVNIVYLTQTTARIAIQRYSYANPASPALVDGISNQFTILMRVPNS